MTNAIYIPLDGGEPLEILQRMIPNRLIYCNETPGTTTVTVPDIYGDGKPYLAAAYIKGGGGGGEGSTTANAIGAGGGEGEETQLEAYITPGQKIVLTVGAGGAGGASGGGAGGTGGTTSFGAIAAAYGGIGGSMQGRGGMGGGYTRFTANPIGAVVKYRIGASGQTAQKTVNMPDQNLINLSGGGSGGGSPYNGGGTTEGKRGGGGCGGGVADNGATIQAGFKGGNGYIWIYARVEGRNE
jgi:hypothetical protein